MSWYFLSCELPVNTDVLRKHEITFTDTEIHTPMHTTGVAFYLEQDETLREILDALGLADTKFKSKETNLDGISLLMPSGSRKKIQPTATAIKQALPDPSVFLELIAGQRVTDITHHQADEQAAATVFEVQRNQFAQSAIRVRDIAMQRQLLNLSDTTFIEFVKNECEKMAQNPRVREIRYGKKIFIVQTTSLTIEQRNEPARLIGELDITINLLDASIRIETEELVGPTAHPNVTENGYLILGSLRDVFIRYLGSRQYSTALKLITDLLCAAPKTEELKRFLQNWPTVV